MPTASVILLLHIVNYIQTLQHAYAITFNHRRQQELNASYSHFDCLLQGMQIKIPQISIQSYQTHDREQLIFN